MSKNNLNIINNVTDRQNKIAEYMMKKPIEVYGDYRDELPDCMAQALLDGDLDSFEDSLMDIEMGYSDNLLEYFSCYFDEMMNDLELESIEDDDIDTIYESYSFDMTDLLDTMFKHANQGITVTPVKKTGEPIDFPHYSYDGKDNRQINAYLKTVHGWDGWKAETTYTSDILKICGSVDFKELYEKLCKGYKPTHINIKSGNLVTHDSWQGSGGCGDLPESKTKRPYYKIDRIKLDDSDSYGVQAVFGFVSSWWGNELDFKYTKVEG